MSDAPAPRRDVVVVGASAGGVEALSSLVAALPGDLGAAVFIVLHIPPSVRSRLPEILSRRTCLEVRQARDGDRIEPGRILVAPPDHHLSLDATGVRLSHGPRQNSTRPSIDALFRSAAATLGERVVGVVLSGYLDDGAAGLREVVAAGGFGVVQDPAEARHPEMPENAIARAGIEVVLPVAEIGRLIVKLTRQETPAKGAAMPDQARAPMRPEWPDVQIGAADAPGVPSGLTCPECHGVLWVGPEPDASLLHCRVGHTYSIQTLQDEQRTAVEKALWAAVRSLREQAAVAGHIANRGDRQGLASISEHYRARERVAIANAEVIEGILMADVPDAPHVPDAAGASA